MESRKWTYDPEYCTKKPKTMLFDHFIVLKWFDSESHFLVGKSDINFILNLCPWFHRPWINTIVNRIDNLHVLKNCHFEIDFFFLIFWQWRMLLCLALRPLCMRNYPRWARVTPSALSSSTSEEIYICFLNVKIIFFF